MKKIILALTLLCQMTFANTVATAFKFDSNLPVVLQQRVLAAVNAQCKNLVSAYGLSEITTSVTAERIDQGVVDYFYETTLNSRYYFDGMHPTSTQITIKSAIYSFSNGDNLSVLSVESYAGCRP